MESEQDAMITEKVSSTASENRKSSKPIMEKRRRARINASLAQLKSLLLEVMKKEGSRQNKMEKADILEITVRHLRQLQKQQFSALAASDPSMINKYRLGFNECASEVGKFLGSMEGVDTEARAKLLGHLANCMVTSESSSTNKCSSKSPTGILDDFSEDCWRKSNCVSLSYTPPQTACTNLNSKPLQPNHLTYSPPQTLSTNCVRNGILDSGINLPSQEQCVTSTVSSTVLPISNTNIPMQSVVGQQQIPSNQPQIQQTIIQQPSQSLQIPKIVSGVQVIPTKMSTGEMAFIIPANILASGQTPNYVIPFLPSQGLATTATTTHAQFPTATMAPLTIIQPTVAKGDIPLNNLSSNTSVNHLSESKPMTTICQTDNLLTENGSPSSTISRKNFNENRFDIGHVTSQPSTIRSQESVNGHNSNIILQSKDNDMWRPW